MTERGVTESVVEQATLVWLENLYYTVKHGSGVAHGELAAERAGYGQVMLEDRLRQALVQLNPQLPYEDWAMRENVRAQLRVFVKRILRKYGYPPDKQEKATQTVLEQAEVLSEVWAAA